MAIEPELTHTAEKRNRFVLEALERRFGSERMTSPAFSVLDLGSGGGELAEALGRAGVSGVLGIDIDGEAIATARNRCGRFGHRFEALEIEEYDSPPIHDVVLLSEVLVCLREPEAALRAARRWVRPGGLGIVTVANGYGPWAWYRRWVERTKKARPRGSPSALGRHRFTGRRLVKMVREAGFLIESWGHSNFLSAVYPFSISRYRPRSFGFIERWDLALAAVLPGALASGWYLSLLPAAIPSPARHARRMEVGSSR